MKKPTLIRASTGLLIVLWVYANVRLFQLDVEFYGDYGWQMMSHRALADACLVLFGSLMLACGIRRIRRRLGGSDSIAMVFVGAFAIAYFSWQCTASHLRFTELDNSYENPIDRIVLEDRHIEIVENTDIPMRTRAGMALLHAQSIYTYTGYKAPIVDNEGQLSIYQPHDEYHRDDWIEALAKLDKALAYNTGRTLIALPIISASIMFGIVAPIRMRQESLTHSKQPHQP